MSSSGKTKKTKWKQIAVGDILPNAIVRPTTSWAEEVESELSEYTIKKISTISLPTAPRAVCDLVIDESKIPPNGPFMAYLSNLPFEITEDDVGQLFKDLKVASIQLPKDNRYDRMKGFGYVEFENKSSLISALREGDLTIKGRSVRISLPNEDDQKDKGSRSGGVSFSRRDGSDRMDSDKALEWRTAAPIPHDPDKSSGFTRQGQRESSGGFRENSGGFRENSGGFRENSSGGFRENSSGGFRENSSGGFRENSSGGFRENSGGGFRENRDRGFDSESSSSFSRGGFKDRERDRDREFDRSSDRGGDRIFGKRYERDDRGGNRMSFGRRYDRDRDDNREYKRYNPAPEKEEAKSRPKFEILPRTKPLDTNRVPDALPSSIFGSAKPVDTMKRELEIEAKLNAATQAPRSRGSSPPPRSVTPVSNRSRSSSVSSMSSCRRQNTQVTESGGESQQYDNSDNEKERVFKKPESVRAPEVKEPMPPKNVWEQRKAATAAATAETGVPDISSVIEKPASTNNSVDAESRSQSEETTKSNELTCPKVDDKNEPSTKSTPSNHNVESDDHFANSESSQQSGRTRYNDNRSNYSRDNRNDRKDDRKDIRKDSRRPDNGQLKRDDSRFGGKPDKRTFPNKTRNNGPSGPRKYSERDNGYNSFRDRNDSRSDFSNRSSSSSMTNLRDDGDSRLEKSERQFHDERLTDSEPINDQKSREAADERLKIVDDNANKTVENGNENGVQSEDGRQSNENITIINDQSELNDEAFSSSKNRKKNRKKDEKKKVLEKSDSELANEKDSEKLAKNQKDEKKKTDILANEKTNNKNNIKIKEKPTKKNRDDISQMPKLKEEKAPNFQGSNRFCCLENDD